MQKRLYAILFTIAIASGAGADEFIKTTYADPYLILVGAFTTGSCVNDTTGLDPMQYFAQLDSLGTNWTHSFANSQSTNNNYGIRIMGQGYEELKVDDTTASLDRLVHYSYYADAQAERSGQDTMIGAWLYRPVGRVYPGGQAPDSGWILDPRQDLAGVAVATRGPAFAAKHGRRHVIRATLKAYDNSAPDTVAYLHYWHHHVGNWYHDTLLIIASDFDSANVWQTFEPDDFAASGDWATISAELYWYGTDSLVVDNIEVLNSVAQVFERITDDQMDSAFTNYYASINTNNHARFYPSDEPMVSSHWGYNRFDDRASSIAPYHRSTSSLNWNIPFFLYNVDPLEVLPNHYPITGNHDSLTTADSSSIQDAYDAFTHRLLDRNGELLPAGKGFIQYIQAGRIGSGEGLDQRDPTTRELKTLIWLSMAYGATGVGYFTYSQLFDPDSCEDHGLPIDIGIHSSPPTPSKAGQSTFNGLVDWNFVTERYEPNERWYAAKEAHGIIDSIWPVLDTLTWEDADDWLGAANLDGSIIDSVHGLTFAADSVYLEVARFTSDADEEFYMLVNRRSLSSDSQDVAIEFDAPSGALLVQDIYLDTTYVLIADSGVATCSLHFEPAQMRVMKVAPAYVGVQSGTWSANRTYEVIGDIYVDTATTLTITSDVNIWGNLDYSTGVGSIDTLIEIIVDGGKLRVVGTEQSPVVLSADTTGGIPSWWGIRVSNDGSIFMDHAEVSHVWNGIYGRLVRLIQSRTRPLVFADHSASIVRVTTF